MSATEAPARPAPLDTGRPAQSGGGVGWPDGPMTWEDVCAHPSLRDLPFKVEQDRYGRILMSPVATRRSILQRRFIKILEDALGGIAIPECAIATTEGTRAADVGWMEESFAQVHQDDPALAIAPPVCVEIMSKWNHWPEMEEKVVLYLAEGAQEVWIHERGGRVRFFGHEGERERSALAPDAPTTVTL